MNSKMKIFSRLSWREKKTCPLLANDACSSSILEGQARPQLPRLRLPRRQETIYIPLYKTKLNVICVKSRRIEPGDTFHDGHI